MSPAKALVELLLVDLEHVGGVAHTVDAHVEHTVVDPVCAEARTPTMRVPPSTEMRSGSPSSP